MIESKKLRILENIITTLEGITTENGYNNNVGLVSDDVLNWTDVPPDSFPAIFAVPDIEDPKRQPFQKYRNQLEIVIGALVEASETRTKSMLSLERDIKKIIHIDRTRGGLANATWLGQIRPVHGLEPPYNYFEISVYVEYDHTMTEP